MNSKEINEAILGTQFKESRYLRLIRMLVWLVGKYLGAIKTTRIQEFYPLPYDPPPKPKAGTKAEREALMERFRKRDEEKRKKQLNGK